MEIYVTKGLFERADLIFVLAGRDYRKRYALELFAKGVAPQVLFSVSRFEIRRFSKLPLPVPLDLLKLVSDVPPAQRHFFVLFNQQTVQITHVRPQRFGTLTEIESLQRWLHHHSDIHSVVLVSSHSHLRRIGICCKFLLTGVVDIALASPPEWSSDPGDSNGLTAVAFEVLKILVYWVMLSLRRGRPRNNPATLRDEP